MYQKVLKTCFQAIPKHTLQYFLNNYTTDIDKVSEKSNIHDNVHKFIIANNNEKRDFLKEFEKKSIYFRIFQHYMHSDYVVG